MSNYPINGGFKFYGKSKESDYAQFEVWCNANDNSDSILTIEVSNFTNKQRVVDILSKYNIKHSIK